MAAQIYSIMYIAAQDNSQTSVWLLSYHFFNMSFHGSDGIVLIRLSFSLLTESCILSHKRAINEAINLSLGIVVSLFQHVSSEPW